MSEFYPGNVIRLIPPRKCDCSDPVVFGHWPRCNTYPAIQLRPIDRSIDDVMAALDLYVNCRYGQPDYAPPEQEPLWDIFPGED